MKRGRSASVLSAADGVEAGSPSNTSNKRARSGKDSGAARLSDTAQDPGFTRDDELWYKDGSIVLVAQSVGFRVYRELLVERSAVFRDLFSLPQPSDSQRVCGCPVVHLSDTTIALKEFLAMLLRGKRYDQKLDPALDVLASRIRLTHKYDVPDLLEDSIRHLQSLYPSDLAAWDPYVYPWDNQQRCITAVNLARLTGTRTVLPVALYACCQLPAGTLLAGAAHQDGSLDTLSEDDLARCMTGKMKLAFMHGASFKTLFQCSANECSGYDCQFALQDIYNSAKSRLKDYEAEILTSWDDLLEQYSGGDEPFATLCAECVKAIRVRDEALRNEVWEELSQYMGLD